MDSDGIPDFYAEINTPQIVKDNYAPAGRCLGCDAKLSIYRNQTYGEWDQWCALCQRKGQLDRPCEACWEMFPSFGTKTICSKCVVPSNRKKREAEAYERAGQAADLIYRYNFSIEKVANVLKYGSTLELRRSLERLQMEIDNDD